MSTSIIDADYYIPFNTSESEFLLNIRNVAKLLVSEFNDTNTNDLKLEQISGGITNTLYKCTSLTNYSVLIRIFGENTEKVIDREREKHIINSLSSYNIGTPIFSRFKNGRIEKFLPSIAFNSDDLNVSRNVELIGKSLGEFHKCEVNLDKNPVLFPTIYNFLDVLTKLEVDDILKDVNFPWLYEQVRFVESYVSKYPKDVVFCHNDLLCGNIMYDDINGVTLIDFEYSAYNYRIFDIANHFCECCGFECDWSKFPSVEQQTLWINSYREKHGNDAPSLDTILLQIPIFALCSHLFWGIWAIFQSKYAKIKFDFKIYSKLRLDGYKMMKEKYNIN